MRCYKFTRTKYLDALLGGQIRLTRLSTFAALEEKQGAWIGDRLEGASEVHLEQMNLEKPSAHEIEALTRGMNVPGHRLVDFKIEGPAVLKNISLTYRFSNEFIFSASVGDIASLTVTMCEPEIDPYDACAEIFDLALLGHRLWHRGIVIDPDLGRARMVLLPPEVRPVQYEAMYVKFGATVQTPSAFLKDLKFAGQKEARIAFKPAMKDEDLPSVITVQVPKPQQLFREVFRDFRRSSTA